VLKHLKDQRGDTIVEVMISIAVVSLVLVAGYVTTTRSVNGMEDTEEHSEALQLAQTQLEYLHNTTALPANNKCFDNKGVIVGGNSCLVNSSGGAAAGGQLQFDINITQVNTQTFAVAVTWPSIDNPGTTNNVTLDYQP